MTTQKQNNFSFHGNKTQKIFSQTNILLHKLNEYIMPIPPKCPIRINLLFMKVHNQEIYEFKGILLEKKTR